MIGGELLFLSDVRGDDPTTGEFSPDVGRQAACAFDKIAARLGFHGLALRHVLRVTVFMNDLALRDPIHEVWLRYFPDEQPARTSFQIADANAVPGAGAQFVLDVVALARPDAVRQTLASPAGGPEHRMHGMVTGVKGGGYLFFSAIRGRDPTTRRFSSDTQEQMRQALDNVKWLLDFHGSAMSDVVRVGMYVNDLTVRERIDDVWRLFFSDPAPALTAVQVVNASASPRGKPHFVLDLMARSG